MLVALPSTPYADTLTYWQLDQKGHIQAQGQLSVERFKQDFQGAPLTLLLPPASTTFLRVKLPVKSKKAIAKSLPFALEDVLAQELDQLHICPGPQVGDEQVAVVIDKALIEHWLSVLKGAFTLNSIAPLESLYCTVEVNGIQIEPSPWADGQWVVLSDHYEPVILDQALLKPWLKKLGNRPVQLINVDAQVLGLTPAPCQVGAKPLSIQALINKPGINLLTGPYRQITPWPWHTWRYAIAASLLACCLGAVVEMQKIHALSTQKLALNAKVSALKQEARLASHPPLGPLLYQVLTLTQPAASVAAIRADTELVEVTLGLESFAKLASLRQSFEQVPLLAAELHEAHALQDGVQTRVSVPRRRL